MFFYDDAVPASGYEVEFMTLAGQTIPVASLMNTQVRPVTRQDIAHVRESFGN